MEELTSLSRLEAALRYAGLRWLWVDPAQIEELVEADPEVDVFELIDKHARDSDFDDPLGRDGRYPIFHGPELRRRAAAIEALMKKGQV